jgi:hypothetical protein
MKPWKVQKFFGDLVYDMRSRGLLPLAALLVVAMVAVPYYLSTQGADTPAPSVTAGDGAELAPENQSAVVAYEPGVRNYRERLAEQSEKDPFIQQFQVSEEATDGLESASGGDALTSSGGGGVGEVDVPEEDEVVVEEGGKPIRLWYFYETDVSIGELGQPPVRRNRVEDFDYLPNEDVPVLSYMGTLHSGKQAIFLVSEDVSTQTGGGSCFPSPERCQLLALGKGETEELTWGPTGKVYRLKIEEIGLVVSRKPPA